MLDDMYHIMAIANYEDKYVISSNHREYAGKLHLIMMLHLKLEVLVVSHLVMAVVVAKSVLAYLWRLG